MNEHLALKINSKPEWKFSFSHKVRAMKIGLPCCIIFGLVTVQSQPFFLTQERFIKSPHFVCISDPIICHPRPHLRGTI